jgi:enamine deaminase RidA (YjgF/YER057c/UK114 family)
MKLQRITSGAKWENTVGYCRALKVGDYVFLSGTTAIDEDGQIVGKGNAYLQTKQILKIIEKALNEVGGKMDNIVRTRIYTTDIRYLDQIGKAHLECFNKNRPASTAVQVAALAIPEMLVEIEADAYIPEEW